MTCLWDAYEFFRQQKRIMKGHAPANRSNPRHARILEEYPPATPIDLLGRDPTGCEVSKEDAINLVAKKENSR